MMYLDHTVEMRSILNGACCEGLSRNFITGVKVGIIKRNKDRALITAEDNKGQSWFGWTYLDYLSRRKTI